MALIKGVKYMEYLVFIIYVIAAIQFINSKPDKKRHTLRGHEFYKKSAIINMIFGYAGLFCVNYFLRDENIIPQLFVWFAIGGFVIIIIYAMYCFYKMVTTIE